MATRLTLADVLRSRLPGTIGLCQVDTAGVAAVTNSATERLIYAKEQSDEGAVGAWSEIAFTVSQTEPHFTAPREVARLMVTNVCTYPVPVQNQFYEFLRWGNGRYPKSTCATDRCAPLETYDRGTVPLFEDITEGKKLRIYLTDNADVGKRVLVQGKDTNDVPVRTLDGLVQVEGEFVVLTAPFVDTANTYNTISGLQKDITFGRVTIYELDPTTADERLLSFMEPGERVASYRRYYIGGLPASCCNGNNVEDVQVTALAKLDFIPVSVPTDYLLIQNIEALIHEAQAIRYDGQDIPASKQMSAYHHRQAIRLLNGQLIHSFGKLAPAVSFSPFGSAHLNLQRIGQLI